MPEFAIANSFPTDGFSRVEAAPSLPIEIVGVLGGGQLAGMLSEAAHHLGLELRIQTPAATDSALYTRQKLDLKSEFILSPITDITATQQLAAECQVITFENEFVDLDALGGLASQGVCFRPNLASLAPLLDKYHQRSSLRAWDIPVPKFDRLLAPELPLGLNFPVVIKARRHGYDGQGTFICQSLVQLQQFWQQAPIPEAEKPQTWMVEDFVPFNRELAVMAARSATGELSLFPIVETYQRHQICHWAIAPSLLAPGPQQQIQEIALQILEKLEMVGILGVEFFQTAAGNILVNEIAPRTHNSGHLSLEACATSQFEQHLRAICGLPLGDTALQVPSAVMVNLLGFESASADYQPQRQALAALPDAHVHWYGKLQSRPGRKLGHVTVLLPSVDRDCALEMAQTVETLWYANSGETRP
ncbi:MAG: 5-(carboxyamino)imidazole ribonucleotide synthase [Acaryochloridaceae cyanobacterium SU_2_1]|nr:5-(carboxyamino)imidazole ribonucleotide synthase [Acaryochloridaceae cyanobacterium SU_2_1]